MGNILEALEVKHLHAPEPILKAGLIYDFVALDHSTLIPEMFATCHSITEELVYYPIGVSITSDMIYDACAILPDSSPNITPA